ncbi:hypothetical protein LTR65_006736 [Meristemomyces frigidus]
MDGLPFEIACRIGEFVHDTHKPSLFALSLTSRKAHAAACASIFRNIHINVSGRAKLAHDVASLVSVLERTQSWKHVRRLEIDGSMPALKDDDGRLSAPEWTLNDQTWYGREEIYGKEDDFTFGSDDDAPGVEDVCWAPLGRLIKRMQYLVDLVFDCPSQFPLRLLGSLHAQQRHCRLHLPQFRFRSLRQPETDPHELAIATSPCLHAIRVLYVRRDSDGHDDYNAEATLRTMAGLAPNLRVVRMVRMHAASSPTLYRSRNRPREPWKGFAPDQFPHQAAVLEHLSLCGVGCIVPKTLENWSKHTDFSSLRSIGLSEGVEGGGLHWLATKCVFSCLRSLELRLVASSTANPRSTSTSDLPTYTISFLVSIPSLESLELSGSLEQAVLNAVLEHHGKTLVRLVLAPSRGSTGEPMQLMLDAVHQMQSSCHMLEDLTMPVRRTKGRPPESAIYQALGTFPRLHTIFLTLDASNPAFDRGTSTMGRDAPDDDSFDDFERLFYDSMHRSRKGHVRTNLINSAVDEALARSIWDAVSANKVGIPLRSLKLTTTGGLQCGMAGSTWLLMNIVQYLSRSYQLTASVRNDSDEVEVCELGKRAREAREQRERGSTVERAECPEIAILRSIWPAKGEDSDWRDEWSSWPLQLGE